MLKYKQSFKKPNLFLVYLEKLGIQLVCVGNVGRWHGGWRFNWKNISEKRGKGV